MVSGRRSAAYALALTGGIAVGGVSALAMAGWLPGTGSLSRGAVDVAGWRSDFAIGSKSADPYTRARVARFGLLALARSEAAYFTRNTDQAGRPLSEACRYRLSGGPMPAQWWSVTLYDGDSRLPMNTDRALSVDASHAGPGTWQATIAPARPEDGMWISSRNAGHFDLTLRLYVADERLFDDPQATLTPPRVERLDCEGAS